MDPDGRNFWDIVQGGLDVVGVIPGIGEVADLANAGISLARGDYLGASLSLISVIPIVGDAIGKTGKVANAALKYSDEIAGALHRPYIRKSTREAVENAARKDSAGRFIDPNTGKAIEGKYDLGHKTGNEFRTEKAKAEAEGLAQKEFNDRMNNPDLYQIEDPSSNRSHRFEAE